MTTTLPATFSNALQVKSLADLKALWNTLPDGEDSDDRIEEWQEESRRHHGDRLPQRNVPRELLFSIPLR